MMWYRMTLVTHSKNLASYQNPRLHLALQRDDMPSLIGRTIMVPLVQNGPEE